MPVSKVVRVYVVVPSALRDEVVAALQDAAIVHLEPLAEEEPAELAQPLSVDTRDLDRRLAELESAIETLAAFASDEPPGAKVSEEAGLGVEEVVAATRQVMAQLSEVEVRRSRLESALQHLLPWSALPVPVELLSSTPSTQILCGTVSTRSLPALRRALAEGGAGWILEEVGSREGKTQVVVADLLGENPDVERILREAGFQPMLFPMSSGTVDEMLAQMRHDVAALEHEAAILRERLRRLARHREALMAAYDETALLRQRVEALGAAAATGETVTLAGWVKARDVARLQTMVYAVGPSVVLTRDPHDDEEPPVVLENRPLVAPAEAVTGLYGMPKYREIDPTPLLAPFFVASFGIAVGEGGYGVILALFARLARRFLKLSEGGKRLMNLLFYCGISTFVAGILMGSFFAIDFTKVPSSLAFLARMHDALMQMDPLKQPLVFLGLVLGLGFLQVWTGVLIGAVVQWRSGQRAKAVLSQGGWLTLLPLTVLLLMRVRIAGLPVLPLWLAAAAAVFVGAGIGVKSLGGRIGAGLFALYGITGFFGDVLSYSRLFALGLATGVMASVINILAVQAKNLPLVGWLLMALILVVGHPVNIAINALGAFVHSARLQFVEFFTKFFEGGGRRFEPFARRYRYGVALSKQGSTVRD